MNIGLVCIVAFGAGIFGWQWYEFHKRAAAIRSLASRLGFVYIGSALPRALSLAGTSLTQVSGVWNVIDGDWHGARVIAFDCRIGTGKGSWRRTVIAVQDTARTLDTSMFSPELSTDRSGEWTLLYEPKSFSFIPTGRLSSNELEANLDAILFR